MPLGGEMDLAFADLLGSKQVLRLAEMARDTETYWTWLSCVQGRQVADLHVFCHAAAKGCHGKALVGLEWDLPVVAACPSIRNGGFATSPTPGPAMWESLGGRLSYPLARPPVSRSGLVQAK